MLKMGFGFIVGVMLTYQVVALPALHDHDVMKGVLSHTLRLLEEVSQVYRWRVEMLEARMCSRDA